MESPSCRFCLAALEPFGVKDGFTILRCAGCGSGAVEVPEGLDPQALYRTGYHSKESAEQRAHGWDDYAAERPALRRSFADRLSVLGRYCPGGALLDVGCGPGYLLELAAERYSRVEGVELGREAVAEARSRGLSVKEGAFGPGLFAAASFDAVTLLDTIEHLGDPVATLRAAADILKPGGVLMLSTGDFSSPVARWSGLRWHLMTPPEHLFFLTRAGLTASLERLGLRVECVRYPHGHFTCDYLVEKTTKIARLGAGYRKAARLRAWLKRIVLPLNLWDIMLVIARKGPLPRK